MESQLFSFASRDGTRIGYRLFAGDSPKGVILVLPGFALTSEDYISFCRSLARTSPVSIYSVDLRGHGHSGGKPGDVSYIGQLRHDLDDMFQLIRAEYPDLPIAVCAHSGGCSLAVDYLVSDSGCKVAALFLIAPVFLGYLEFDRVQTSAYRRIHYGKYLRVPARNTPSRQQINQQFKFSLVKQLFCRLFAVAGRLNVLSVRRSVTAPWQHFTYRFLESYRCRRLYAQLARLTSPVWILIGGEDEFVLPEAVLSAIRWHVSPDVLRKMLCMSSIGHFTVLPAASMLVSNWLNGIIQAPSQRASA